MKFQKKIVFSFVGFSAIIILILIGIYSYFSFKDLKKTEYENTRMVATTKAKQFEDMLKKMDNVSLYLLSDQSFLDATVTVSRSTNKSYEDIYFNEDVTVIRNALNNYYFMKQFYRVIYFNENDIVIANNNFNSTNKIDNNVHVKDIPWLPKVKNTVGENQVIGIHKDDWDYLNNYDVLSTVMEIQGNDRGFIEVQQKKEAIDSFMNDEVMNMDYVVLDTKNGELIYTNNEDINYTEYIDIIGKNNKNIYKYENLKGKNEILFEQKIFNDSLVFLAINSNDFKEDIINKILPLTLIIFILFAMFVFAYVYTTSQILSQPIKKLQKIMEQSAGEDFSIDMPTKISNDEIEILYKYYIEALEKRQDAVLQEKKLSMLQLQAQFDLLQAQVNPHFIYNVLNVISNRGMINSDEMICDICSDLAGMLRYSTNTKEKYATVNTEIEYLELYLSLLKHRYEHRLMYSIEIDNSIKNERLPKILLQQIAENSVVHGYGNSDSIIEIVVKGVLKDSGFEIIVSDNGDGITEDTINAIYKSFDDIKKKFTDNRVNVEMEIGGMGLLNTFARLYLLYNESAYIHLHSKSTGGTEVVIGVKYK